MSENASSFVLCGKGQTHQKEEQQSKRQFHRWRHGVFSSAGRKAYVFYSVELHFLGDLFFIAASSPLSSVIAFIEVISVLHSRTLLRTGSKSCFTQDRESCKLLSGIIG